MHRVRSDEALRDFLGWVTVVTALALALPGIQIARAEDEVGSPALAMSLDLLLVEQASSFEPDGPAVAPGPICSAPAVPALLDDALAEYQAQQMLRTLVERVARQAPALGSEAQGIALNGQGYNYPRRSARNAP